MSRNTISRLLATILGQSKDTYRLAPYKTSYAIILKMENHFRVELLDY